MRFRIATQSIVTNRESTFESVWEFSTESFSRLDAAIMFGFTIGRSDDFNVILEKDTVDGKEVVACFHMYGVYNEDCLPRLTEVLRKTGW